MRKNTWFNGEDYDHETEERWSRPRRERIQRKANRHCHEKREAQRYREQEAAREIEFA